MQKIGFFVSASIVALTACSSATSSTPLSSCDQSKREGTYLVHYEDESGNCGEVPDENVVLVDSDGGAAGTCTVNSESISTNGCEIDRDTTCPIATGGTIRTVGVTTQQTADGSELSGSLTFYITGTSSDCVGTYNVTFQRQ